LHDVLDLLLACPAAGLRETGIEFLAKALDARRHRLFQAPRYVLVGAVTVRRQREAQHRAGCSESGHQPPILGHHTRPLIAALTISAKAYALKSIRSTVAFNILPAFMKRSIRRFHSPRHDGGAPVKTRSNKILCIAIATIAVR
jgi:hypothetical protein